jgi:hypothetical protein
MYAYFGGVQRLSYIQPFSAILVVFDESEWSLHLFYLLVLALLAQHQGQVVHARQCVRMLLAQHRPLSPNAWSCISSACSHLP